jgi:hypothetical protein
VENTSATYNRLRMMYVIDKTPSLRDDIGNVKHIADSTFVLNFRSNEVALKKFREGYFAAVKADSGTTAGMYFEKYWHQWFVKKNIKEIGVINGKGPHTDSILALNEQRKYWFPQLENFPHIDAALVLDTTLYGFQYTVQKGKNKATHCCGRIYERCSKSCQENNGGY